MLLLSRPIVNENFKVITVLCLQCSQEILWFQWSTLFSERKSATLNSVFHARKAGDINRRYRKKKYDRHFSKMYASCSSSEYIPLFFYCLLLLNAKKGMTFDLIKDCWSFKNLMDVWIVLEIIDFLNIPILQLLLKGKQQIKTD